MSRCPHCSGTHGAENHFCPATGQPIDLGPRLISQSLLDRFRVVTILGEGPIGIVVEVEERNTERRFAAKLIHPQYTRDPAAAEKLLEEAKRAGNLGCKHIAEVVEIGRDTGAALTVVRELMTGQCLEVYIDEQGQLPVDEAVKITREILVALDAIHKAGMVNLDLSPADVFLADEGGERIVKLVDIGERHIKQELVLQDSEEFESRNYYAPEQYDLSRQTNPRSDVFAAGAILYHMVTGEVPPGDPKPVTTLRPEISNGLSQVIHMAMAATPGNRFHSVADFIDALDKAIAAPTDANSGVQAEPAAEGGEPSIVVSDEPSMNASSSPPSNPVAQPSVIVDMPEMEKRFPLFYSKGFRIGAVVVVLAAIVAGIVLTQGGEDEKQLEKIAITVEVDPLGAAVSVDNKRFQGNPILIEAVPDNKLHTVRAKADGYEPLERDVKFDTTKTIQMSLAEIIEPEAEKEEPLVEKEEPLIEEIKPDTGEPEQVAEEVAAPEPEPEPIEEKPEIKEEPAPAPKPAPRAAPAPKKKPKAKSRPVAAPKKKPKAKARPAPAPKKKPAAPKKPGKKKKSREGFSTSNPFG